MNENPKLTDQEIRRMALSIAMSQVRIRIDRHLMVAGLCAAAAVTTRYFGHTSAMLVLGTLCARELMPAAALMRMHHRMRLLRQYLSRV